MKTTLLSRKQAWGGCDSLDVIRKYGSKVAPTDLAVLLGCFMESKPNCDYTSEGDITCATWCASPIDKGVVDAMSHNGKRGNADASGRALAIRPILLPSETFKITPNNIKTDASGIRTVEYGEYPQTVADEHISAQLEKWYRTGHLPSTGKHYTFDATDGADYDVSFEENVCPEYKLDGKKYIRVVGAPVEGTDGGSDGECLGHPGIYGILSSGKLAHAGHPYWVEVKPIEWLVDRSTTWVSKKALISGIQYDPAMRNKDDFSKSFMAEYLRTCFDYEMLPTDEYLKATKERDALAETKRKEERRFNLFRPKMRA
ncbi:MAG: hypothetical protein II942_00855 [Alphaproteobacteria bacterium]|nr:hypothetical protein [Alphaproteobacteria bacterium]